MKLFKITVATLSISFVATLNLLAASAMAADPLVRKNVVNLTPEEKSAFVDALHVLKNTIPEGSQTSIYEQFVALHVGTMGFMQNPAVNSNYPNGFMYMDMDRTPVDASDPDHDHKPHAHGPAVGADAAHGNAAFFPWHREYISRFEKALQSVNPNITLPYWDWTDAQAWSTIFDPNFLGPNGQGDIVQVPYDDGVYEGGPVVSGNFSEASGWVLNPDLHFGPTGDPRGTSLLRYLGLAPFNNIPLPKEDVDRALAIDNYENFRLAIEGWPYVDKDGNLVLKFSNHNVVHGTVGGTIWDIREFPPTDIPQPLGTMTFVSTPYDPVFWLLHANVDRLWTEWQNDGHEGSDFYPSEGQPYGHNLNDRMWPWDGGQSIPMNMGPGNLYDYLPKFDKDDIVTPADTLNVASRYDYTYDTLLKSVPEPNSTLSLLGLGALGAAGVLRRKRSHKRMVNFNQVPAIATVPEKVKAKI
ncbi:tyrosinase [Nostoc sp. NIES-4103]|nr:tyrosinase [Nostoc sp. NIES-4103]